MSKETMKLALEDYLSREMPAGTVIGDPKWWAAKIANVMTGKAVAEVYKQGYDHGVERQEAIQKLSEIEKQTPASKNQWWAKELEGFWGDSDYQVTLDTRRAAKTALTVIFDNSQPKQEQGEPVAWKLVPIEPTREMLDAMDECSMEGYDERLYAGHAASVYMAAVDVAPTQPQRKEPEQEPVAKEMTAHRAAYFMERFKHEEKLLGPNEQAALDFVIAMLEAQPEQEPVALETIYETIIQWDEGGGKRSRRELARRISSLYTTPPHRKPLSDEEIILIVAECASSHQHTDIHFARAIEAAHGIKE